MSNQFYIFISHSSEDKVLANSLCKYLEKEGLNCWIAPRNIRVGANYAHGIMEGITNSAVMIVLVTKDSNKSNHVLNEIQRAAHRDIGIIPIRVDNSPLSPSMELFLGSRQWLDVRQKKLTDMLHELIESCRLYVHESSTGSEQSNRIQITDSKDEKTVSNNSKIIFISLLVLVLCFVTWLIWNQLKNPTDTLSGNNIKQTDRDTNNITKDIHQVPSSIANVNKQTAPIEKAFSLKSDNTKSQTKSNEPLKDNLSVSPSGKKSTPSKIDVQEENIGIESKKNIQSFSNTALLGKFENYLTNEYLEFMPNGKGIMYSGKLSGYIISGSVSKTGENTFRLNGEAIGQFYLAGKEIRGSAKTKESGVKELREFKLTNHD